MNQHATIIFVNPELGVRVKVPEESTENVLVFVASYLMENCGCDVPVMISGGASVRPETVPLNVAL